MHEILDSEVFETAFFRYIDWNERLFEPQDLNWKERLFHSVPVLFSMWDTLSDRGWTFTLQSTAANPAQPSSIATNLKAGTVTFSINPSHDPLILVEDIARTLKTISQHDEAEQIASKKNIQDFSGWHQLAEDTNISLLLRQQGHNQAHFSPAYHLSTPSDFILEEAVRLFDAHYFGKLVRVAAERQFLGTGLAVKGLPSLVTQSNLNEALSSEVKDSALINRALTVSITRFEALDQIFRHYEEWRPNVKQLKPVNAETLLDVTLPFWDELRLNFAPMLSQGFVSPFKSQSDAAALDYIRLQMLHSPHCYPEAIRKEITRDWHGLVPFQPGTVACETLPRLFKPLGAEEENEIVEGLRYHQSYLLPTPGDKRRAAWKKARSIVVPLGTADFYADAAHAIVGKIEAGAKRAKMRYYAKDTARSARSAEKDLEYIRRSIPDSKLEENHPLIALLHSEPFSIQTGSPEHLNRVLAQLKSEADQARRDSVTKAIQSRPYGNELDEEALFSKALEHSVRPDPVTLPLESVSRRGTRSPILL